MSGVPNKKYRAIITVITRMTSFAGNIYISISDRKYIARKVNVGKKCKYCKFFFFNIWINKSEVSIGSVEKKYRVVEL